MENKKVYVNVNVGGFFGLLTIVFTTLKLIGSIDWSWWWVLAPLWLPVTVVIAGLGIFFGGAVLVVVIRALVESYHSKKRGKVKVK